MDWLKFVLGRGLMTCSSEYDNELFLFHKQRRICRPAKHCKLFTKICLLHHDVIVFLQFEFKCRVYQEGHRV
jgi:hypothetical protein